MPERLFNVGLELTITWINRIPFLKLLEAQLVAYHRNDPAYSFMNLSRIRDFDSLNSLFSVYWLANPKTATQTYRRRLSLCRI